MTGVLGVLLASGSTAAPATAILDGVSNVLAGYGIRKLRTAYAGSAVRIRRSSDSAEQDIGFSGADFDAASFSSFIGGGSGFVKTWYDQSGNANNVTQATTSAQPTLTLSGQNSQPVVTFAGSHTLHGTWATGPATNLGVEVVAKIGGPFNAFYELTPAGSLNTGTSLFNDGNWNLRLTATTDKQVAGASTTARQFAAIVTATEMTLVIDNSSSGTGSSVSFPGSCVDFLMGSLNGAYPLTGFIAEMLFIEQDLDSGADATFRSNQKSYWGTP